MFSRRTSPESPKSPFIVALESARRRGQPLLDLTVSNPTAARVPYAERAILSAFSLPALMRYEPEAFGPRAARELLARHWAERGFQVSEQHIVLSASTSESYSLIFKLLCDAGDEILVPVPSYPLFEQLARFEEVVVVPYPLGFDGAWYFDIEAVGRRISNRTRAIVVVSPNNPTGNYLRHSELQQLRQFELPIVSDEVFDSYAIEAPRDRARSALALEGSPVFALSGLSKLAALPQMKLAWMTLGGPPTWLQEATFRLEQLADAYLSTGAPVLAALETLLATRSVAENHILSRVIDNASWLRRALSNSPVSALPVQGGWYAMLQLPRTRDDESWATSLLSEAGVIVQPGYFYDSLGEALVVVSLLTPPSEFAEGVLRLREHVQVASP